MAYSPSEAAMVVVRIKPLCDNPFHGIFLNTWFRLLLKEKSSLIVST